MSYTSVWGHAHWINLFNKCIVIHIPLPPDYLNVSYKFKGQHWLSVSNKHLHSLAHLTDFYQHKFITFEMVRVQEMDGLYGFSCHH